jgi:uncharacterized protein YkwD
MSRKFAGIESIAWLAAALCCIGTLLTFGCANQRTLAWRYAGDTAALANAKRVAVANQTSFLDNMPFGGTGQSALVNAIVDELMANGYQVTLLEKPALPTPNVTVTGVPPAMQAKTSQTQTAAELAKAAVEAKADILFEFSTTLSQKMSMRMGPVIPFTPVTSQTEWHYEVRQVTLRISRPPEPTILGTVSLDYRNPQKELRDVMKDVILGLNQIRQSKPAASLELNGKPGAMEGSKPAAR